MAPSAGKYESGIRESHMKATGEIGQNPDRLLWLVLALALTAGSCIIVYHAIHTPTYTIDSYFYLSKAEQLAEGQGLRTTWNDGIDAKFFPGYSIVLALSFLLTDSYIPMQIICYLMCAVFLYLLTKELDVEPVERLLTVTAFAVNPIVIKWLSLPMTEGLATALSILSVYLFLRAIKHERRTPILVACMVGGIATIVRVESLFLLAVFGLLAFPYRKKLSRPVLLAGAALFVFPLLAYWIQLMIRAGEGPAYIEEFRRTFLRSDIIKNFAYNVWAPFGFMHKSIDFRDSAKLAVATVSAGAIWLLLGGLVFVGGLIFSIPGRLGSRLRAIGFLFLAYAMIHSLWYYRYERFMLMAVPLAAMLWAGAAREFFRSIGLSGKRQLRYLMLLQLLLAAAGLFFGNQFSRHHRTALQEDTSWLGFQHIAETVNTLNEESRAAVLTDLGPHLAYYVDAHTYLDTEHGNFWQRAFPPERTLEKMENLKIGFVVTAKAFDQWIEEHKIGAGGREMFEPLEGQVNGALIIKYSSHPENGQHMLQ